MSSVPRDDVTQADPTPQAQRRLVAIGLWFAIAALVTYALPGERLRPWVSGEGIPIARMFDDEDDTLPGFAEAGTQFSGATAQDSAVHAAQQPRAAAPKGAPGAHSPAAGPILRIDAGEYEGISQQIEQPRALEAFFAKLARVGRRERAAIARVAHYGDSAVAADGITAKLRRNLQRRFGDAGHGFVLISRGDMHYNHRDVVHRNSSGWESHSTVYASLRPGLYGYGGVQARGKGGDTATFSTVSEGELGRKVSRFELFYQRFRGAGKVELKVDGKRVGLLETRGDRVEDAWEVIEVPDGAHSLSLRVVGAVRLYGVALERSTPGVVYDSLGLVGARADRLLNSDRAHLQAQIAHRAPDLMVLGFGGNESANKWLNIAQYERELTDVVLAMRGGRREMSCLLLGPLDQAERDERGRIVTVSVLPKIVETQRRVALQQGCAFFDAYAAMGGSGSISKWLKKRPRLATSDLRHATPAGYDVIGDMYYKALLKAFASYLSAPGRS